MLLDANLFSSVIEHPLSKPVLSIVNFCFLRLLHNGCQAFFLEFFFYLYLYVESKMKPLQISPFHTDCINFFELTGQSD